MTLTSAGAAQTTKSDVPSRRDPLPPALPRTHAPKPTASKISTEDLKTRLYIFADDSMMGRQAGGIGNVRATDYLAAEARKIGLRPAGDSGTYFQTLVVNPKPLYPMRNVVAIIPGSDPVLRHQYIALGAHSDHVGITRSAIDHDSMRVYSHVMFSRGVIDASSNRGAPTKEQAETINTELVKLRKLNPPRQDSINNGADDDASGSVALLEIAQAISAMKVRPKRSLLFVWHTAEETGLVGSTWFVNNPPVPLDSIVAQFNLDMVGRGSTSDRVGGGPQYLRLEGARCLSKELDTLINTVNQQRKQIFQFDYSKNLPSGSDHVSYARKGIPVILFITGFHPDYHMRTDEPQYVDYDKMTQVVTFIHDVTLRRANLDHRLRIDDPNRRTENTGCPNGV